MGFLLHFGWGWVCSFFGSLPIGSINLSVTETAIQRGIRVGLYMGIGASIVEFFQSYIALSFYHILTHNPAMERTIIEICIPIFLLIGIYYLFKKNKSPNKPTTRASHFIGFAKGVIVSSLNMIAIPYYVFIGGYLHTSNYFEKLGINIRLEAKFIAAFAFGVVIGSFMVFIIYAKLGQVIKNKSEKLSRYASKIVGAIFIAIAISQAFRYYW
ncbi:MAG: LysE family transporter [Saprospiraceae bacterium]